MIVVSAISPRDSDLYNKFHMGGWEKFTMYELLTNKSYRDEEKEE